MICEEEILAAELVFQEVGVPDYSIQREACRIVHAASQLSCVGPVDKNVAILALGVLRFHCDKEPKILDRFQHEIVKSPEKNLAVGCCPDSDLPENVAVVDESAGD